MSDLDDILSPYAEDEHRSDTLVEPGEGEPGSGDKNRASKESETDKYEFAGEIARGGMGVILSARDTRIGREVAMKVVSSGWRESRAFTERFVREAQVQGRLEHPNICPVHELGTDAEDGPYFTMKMVHGYSLAEMIKRGGEDSRDPKRLTEILNVFLKICDGMAYAHSRGFIHRDLKPDNIMVGDFGEVYVMDWGLARVLGSSEDDSRLGLVIDERSDRADTMKTMAGSVVGTPAYMPPEQAKGLVEEMDERSDIYSLGALLYELVALDPPFSGESAWDVLSKITSEDPPPPSRKSRTGHLPPELDSIIMKCLSKDKEVRYPSVLELKAEIELFLSGRPVGAMDYNFWQILAKWVGRNKAVTFSAAAVLLVIIAAATIAYINMSRSWKNEQFARLQAEENARTARTALEEAETQRKIAEERRSQAETNALKNRLTMAMMLEEKGEIGEAVELYRQIKREMLEKRLGLFPFIDLAIWRAQYNDGRCIRLDRSMNREHPISHRVAFSPDGRTLAVACVNGVIQLWNLSAGELSGQLAGTTEPVYSLAFSPDGTLLAAGYRDANALLWDVVARRAVGRFRDSKIPGGTTHASAVRCVDFSPDGTLLATTGDESIKLWNVRERTIAARLFGHVQSAGTVDFSPDGKWLVSGGRDKHVGLWDVEDGTLSKILYAHKDRVHTVAFTPDGARVVSASSDTTIKVWSLPEEREVASLRGHETDVYSIGISSDGRMLVSSGRDCTVRFWDLERLALIASFKEHVEPVESVMFSPAGKMAASAGINGAVNIWSLNKDTMVKTIDLSSFGYKVTSLDYTGDGGLLAAGLWGRKLVPALLIDPGTGAILHRMSSMGGKTDSVEFNRDDTLLATGTDDGLLRIFDVERAECLMMINAHEEKTTTFMSHLMTVTQLLDKSPEEIWKNVNEVAFNPSGSVIATVCEDGMLRIWDAGSYELVEKFTVPQELFSLDYSPDGAFLAAAGRTASIYVWDMNGRKLTASLAGHDTSIRTVRFSPDGRFLASGSDDKTIRIWDLARRECVNVLEGHFAGLNEINFSPDGYLLASGDDGSTVKIWDVAGGTCLLTLKEHRHDVNAVTFSPDGTTLATGSRDKSIKLWAFGDALKPLKF